MPTLIQDVRQGSLTSILVKKSVEALYSEYTKGSEIDDDFLQASRVLLIQKTTFFVWMMYDSELSSSELRSTRQYFEKFKIRSAKATSAPPAAAMKALEDWLDHQTSLKRANHRPSSQFEMLAYPCLIAFHAVVFGKHSGTNVETTAGRFIQQYFTILWEGLASSRLEISDYAERKRQIKKPHLCKDLGAVQKAVLKYRQAAHQHVEIIKASMGPMIIELKSQEK